MTELLLPPCTTKESKAWQSQSQPNSSHREKECTPLRNGQHGGTGVQSAFSRFNSRLFQSTPLREGRLRRALLYQPLQSFNPRPCVRGDRPLFVGGSGLPRFNPRPCVRGDAGGVDVGGGPGWFQSTPLREGRLPMDARRGAKPLFQSTPLREGRPAIGGAGLLVSVFQSTPLREGRPGAPVPAPRPRLVSIHAPA